jgi:TolB-like protein/Flp pilus assembly protein TadD/class 3 adenylate cyclase
MAAEVKKEIQLEIAHVLFTDIVGYSKLPITQQRALIERLNEIVRGTDEFQAAETAGRLITIPTGDGITLVFYHSPEAPVECALEISRALKKYPELQLRMGIHSGPVSGVIDATGKANVAGAGINTAQRVMDCGDAGHILLSKHVAEDLEEYPHWQPHLHKLGECEVKHGVRVSVVNLYTPELGNPAVPEKLKAAHVAAAARRKRAAFRWLSLGVVTLLAVIAVIGFLLFRYRRPLATVELPGPEKSIAVLPFENRSRDPDNAYFADGIQDEILTRLSKIADLKVISRTSTQHYKSAPENLPEIAKQLGVAHIVEGSVQKRGDSVRVNVQLIKAANDSHLWADTFDRKLSDIFAIESEIAKTVADTLQAKLTGPQERSISAIPTDNPVAYQLYLKGRYFWNKRTGESLKRAVDYFNQAIGVDPKYALAYAGLADAYILQPDYGGVYSQECYPKARAAATTALELDDTIGEGHTALGGVLGKEGDFAHAREELRRAIQLNPNYATAHHWLAEAVLLPLGRFDEAIAELKRALELDPLSLMINAALGALYTSARRYDEALLQLRRTLDLDPNFYPTVLFLAQMAELKGDHKTAVAGYHKALTLSGGDPSILCYLAYSLAMAGKREEALKVLVQLNQISADRSTSLFIPAFDFAIVHLGLGDRDEALRWLEKSYEDRGREDLVQIRVHPFLVPLHGDTRFETLAEKIVPARDFAATTISK